MRLVEETITDYGLMTARKSLLFLCPSLENGRDGVGDYSMQIGEELRKIGYVVYYASLNDRFVDGVSRSDCNRTLRLSSVLTRDVRAEALKQFIAECDPDWISLQWVGFGYEKRGLPWSLAELISEIRKGRRLNIFFHEIWLGEKPGLSFKHRLLGFFQRILIKRLYEKSKPDFCFTNCDLYKRLLLKSGIPSESHPVISNIPVFRSGNGSGVIEGDLSTELGLESCQNEVRIVLFCSIDSEWDYALSSRKFEAIAHCLNRRLRIFSLGFQGNGSDVWIKFKELLSHAENIQGFELGERKAFEVSLILQNMHFGALTKSMDLLDKSGSFAALAEHGLPTLILHNPMETKQTLVSREWEVPVISLVDEEAQVISDWMLQFSTRGDFSSRIQSTLLAYVEGMRRSSESDYE